MMWHDLFGYWTIESIILISALITWVGFRIMLWVVNSEAPFKRAFWVVAVIILLAKVATPAAATEEQLDLIADQLVEQASDGTVAEGMATIIQLFEYWETEENFRNIMENLARETDDYPVTLYRWINYCLLHAGDVGPMHFIQPDLSAANRMQIERSKR